MNRCLQHARMEVHYETNGAFLEEGQLLKEENVAKIRHIPCLFLASPLRDHIRRIVANNLRR